MIAWQLRIGTRRLLQTSSAPQPDPHAAAPVGSTGAPPAGRMLFARDARDAGEERHDMSQTTGATASGAHAQGAREAAETSAGVRVVRASEGSEATAQTAGFVRRELVAAPGA